MSGIRTPDAANAITRSKGAPGGTEGHVDTDNTIKTVPMKPCQSQGVEHAALHEALLVVQRGSMLFGTLCPKHTEHRIQKWLNNVELARSFPLGKFPLTRSVTGSLVKKEKRTCVQFSSAQKNYELTWSEQKGGHYIETYPSKGPCGTIPTDTQTTDVSQAWLASRGYRGGAGSPPPSSISEWQGEDGSEETEPKDEEAAQADYAIHVPSISPPENDTYLSQQRPELIRSDSVLAVDELDRLTSHMDISQDHSPKIPIITVQPAELLEGLESNGSNVPWKTKATIEQQADLERHGQAVRDMTTRRCLDAIEKQRLRFQALRVIISATRARAAVVIPAPTAALKTDWGLSVKKAAFKRRNTM